MATIKQTNLTQKKRTFPGGDPISNSPTYRNISTNQAVQVKGDKGDPQVKGVKAKYHNQKPISMDPKNVKLGGSRNSKLVHNGR